MEDDFNEAVFMETTYKVVTKKVTLRDLCNKSDDIILSYDPFAKGEVDQVELVEDLIEYYIETEEYEKCQELLNIKEKIEKRELDLSDRIFIKDEDIIQDEISHLIYSYKHNKFNLN